MPDSIRIYLNPSFDDEKKEVIERYYEDYIGSDFTRAARDVKNSILEKSGSLGMCGGLITSGWMDMDRMNQRPILIHIRSDHNRPERKVKKGSKGRLFSGFAILEFKEEASGTYLYLDGLCSNVGKAGVLMDFVINHLGKKLLDTGLISGLKLSALGYVIGYYYKKYGFKFYKKYKNKLIEDTLVNTALRDKFSKYVYNADDEYEVIEEFTGNWNSKMYQLLEDGEMKNITSRRVLKKLKGLNQELAKLINTKNGDSPKNRRETLTKRLEIVRQIQKIIKEQNEKIQKYVESGFTPIYEFYLLAKEHSAENVHILTRGRSESALAKQLEEQGISNEGFYMYLLPNSMSSKASVATVARGSTKKRRKKRKNTKRKNTKRKTANRNNTRKNMRKNMRRNNKKKSTKRKRKK